MATNASQWKDIFEAVEHLDTTAVKYFVEQTHASLDTTNSDEQTVAHIAAKNKDLDTLKYLLSIEPSLLGRGDIVHNSVVNLLITVDAIEVIKYLVEERLLDISQPISKFFGNTAIHEAAEKGRLEILKYFIEEKHGDANIRNEFGEPPVFLAANRDHLRIVKYLFAKGANLTATDEYNDNILYISARKGDLPLAKFLLDEKRVPLKMNWRNNANETIVHTAAKVNQINFLRYIIGQKHADINARDKQGRSALHFAARANLYDMIHYLYKHGANPQLRDVNGKTPLELASEINVIRYLDKITMTRHRRSVSIEPVILPTPAQTVDLKEWIAGPCDAFSGGSRERLTDFFVLADFWFNYFVAHRRNHRRSLEKYSLSAGRYIESRIDQFALDAVNNNDEFTFT